jgi:hypothetical protein
MKSTSPTFRERPAGGPAQGIVSPQAHRIDQHQLADPIAKGSRIFGGDHSAKRMADQVDAVQAQAVEQIVIMQKQIRNAVEMLEVFGLFGASVRKRIDASTTVMVVPSLGDVSLGPILMVDLQTCQVFCPLL